jgi:hypothetical protein
MGIGKAGFEVWQWLIIPQLAVLFFTIENQGADRNVLLSLDGTSTYLELDGHHWDVDYIMTSRG